MHSNPELLKLLKPRLNKYINHNPTPKQTAFLLLDCLEAFYGGACGGGKTEALLIAALQYIDIPGYHALLIRDTYQNLSKPDSLIPRSHEWLSNTDARWNGEKKMWTFPGGSTLSFGHLDGPLDHFHFQSSSYQFVGIDELVQTRKDQALYLFSRLRRLKKYSFVPIRFRGASNPPAKEQVARGSWVKERYIDPDTREKDIVFIPAWMSDNPYLDGEEYERALDRLDLITREQLKKGNWDIAAKGRLFEREWFPIITASPGEMKRVRYWDFAATEPSKNNKEPDFTVGCKMGRLKDGRFLIEDINRFRKQPGPTEKMCRQTAMLDGREVEQWMEQEPGSSGKTVAAHYRTKVFHGFVFNTERVTGSKYSRAEPMSSMAEAENIMLLKGKWNKAFLEEIELFPDGSFDDQVSGASGAYNALCGPVIRPRIRVI